METANMPEMIYVPGGHGRVGSNRRLSALPDMGVDLLPFWMSRYPITVGQWLEVIHSEDPYDGLLSANQPNRRLNYLTDVSNYPVTSVSWCEVQTWLVKASKYWGMTLNLPSEIQWEYAARFNGSSNPRFSSRYLHESREGELRHCLPIGSTGSANSLGLEDLAGNIWEMCSDVHLGNHGDGTNIKDFRIRSLTNRTVKGGCYLSSISDLLYTTRTYVLEASSNDTVGFRVVCMDNPAISKSEDVMLWLSS